MSFVTTHKLCKEFIVFVGLYYIILINNLCSTEDLSLETSSSSTQLFNKVEENSPHFVLEIDGDEDVAKEIATTHLVTLVNKVLQDGSFYHFKSLLTSLDKDYIENLVKNFTQHPEVKRCYHDPYRVRENRHHRLVLSSHYRDAWTVNASNLPKFTITRRGLQSYFFNSTNEKIPSNPTNLNIENVVSFNDPLFSEQWYLQNTGQIGRTGYDLNVTWAWAQGYTGNGITCSVLDDGIQENNLDLIGNYDEAVSYKVPSIDGIESDSYSTNPHGTYCATVIAGVSNNSICGVGVAYQAKVAGVSLPLGRVADIQEASALTSRLSKVDVYSSSWGPPDNGKTVDGPGPLSKKALKEGIKMGRNGKGAIYVWASGNGGYEGDNCNLDGYISSIYTLSVSALDDQGLSAGYSEPCSSILAGVPITSDKDVKRNDNEDNSNDVVVTDLQGNCNNHFQGTSAAAPLMTGIVALVLQANPSLTWRDIQHLVVTTSSPTAEGQKEEGWKTNAAGHRFHLKQGFGLINGGKMVELALNWKQVAPQRTIYMPFTNVSNTLINGWVNNSKELSYDLSPKEGIITLLEHVVVNISLEHSFRGQLELFLKSPSGTESQLLTKRPHDHSSEGFPQWAFTSVHFWGERPKGSWTIALRDHSNNPGRIFNVTLIIYGT